MRDDERLFLFSVQLVIVMLVLVAVFAFLFDKDDRLLKEKNREIVTLEQDLKNADARFSGMVRPEALRPIAMGAYPNYRPIGTGRTIRAKNME